MIENKKSYRERIADGECVSPYTTEHCPVCVDRCEAAYWRMYMKDTLKDLSVEPPLPEPPKQ